MEISSLNVGCGLDPWGDVRLDLGCDFLDWHFKPTILADAHYLPFRDGAFKKAKSSHVLEHLKCPSKALNELTRVTQEEIILRFPTEKDSWPMVISRILPFPNISSLKTAYQTRKRRLHLWVIDPKAIVKYFAEKGWDSSCKANTASIFAFFEGGRKAKYFKWLTRNSRIHIDYEIVAQPSPASKALLQNHITENENCI
jgi:hypothetical protein